MMSREFCWGFFFFWKFSLLIDQKTVMLPFHAQGHCFGGCEAWSCYNYLVDRRGDPSTLKMAKWKKEKPTLGYLVEYSVP